MRKLLACVIIVIISSVMYSQSPLKMNYQAVIRNSNNALITNTNIGIKISIIQGTENGAVTYAETHTALSNSNGLVSFKIGEGVIVSGNFPGIDWASGPYFIKTEFDPNGGISYTISATNQFVSVPYAFYAENAGNGFSGDYNDLTNTPVIPTQTNQLTNNSGFLTVYNETDPVYSGSVAYGITALDTIKWNNSGNFSGDYNDLYNLPTIPTQTGQLTNNSGFITGYTETDPIYNISVASEISASDTFRWGNKSEFSGNYSDLSDKPVNVTTSADGFMSAGDKTKLDGLQNANITAGSGITVTGTYPDITVGQLTKHYIGELYGGGIVFWVSPDTNSGLVMSVQELSDSIIWSEDTITIIGANDLYNGSANTSAIIAVTVLENNAARICADYIGGGYTDWYLPASWQIAEIYRNAYTLNYILINDGNGATEPLIMDQTWASPFPVYWSSTESTDKNAWCQYFQAGSMTDYNKINLFRVRAVRSF